MRIVGNEVIVNEQDLKWWWFFLHPISSMVFQHYGEMCFHRYIPDNMLRGLKDKSMYEEYKRNVEILEKLKYLKSCGEVFNQMTGSLYSNIKADEINEIIYDLKENYGIDPCVYQKTPGRADFSFVDRLIERLCI